MAGFNLWAVECPWCGAEVGKACTTPRSNRAVSTHRDRGRLYLARLRNEYFWVKVAVSRADDIAVGDIFKAETCQLYPDKVALLERRGDHYNPNRNAYISDLDLLGFTRDMTPTKEN